MITYIIRRLLQGLVVLFLVSVIVFFSVRLLPGDPVLIFVSQQQTGGSMTGAAPKAAGRVRAGQAGPRPVCQLGQGESSQGTWASRSCTARTLAGYCADRFPVTLYLGLISIVVSTIFGIFFGMIAAIRRGKPVDSVVTFASYIGLTIPVFMLAILLIYVFGLKLGWLPIAGYTSPLDNLWLSLKQSVMPVICLVVVPLAVTARQMRSSVLEVNNMDYIRTAWSKGLGEKVVVTRHILKNSLLPVVTMLGISIGLIFGGAVIIENMFAIPGVGRLLVGAVFGQDYVVIQGGTLVIAAIIIVVNLIVDISYGWLDPRIRYE